MELLKNLELVEVAYESEGKKAVLTFLDEENGEVREVNFNRQSYKDNKFVDDPEKAKKVDEWCKEYFNCDFDSLSECIGVRKDIYAYDRFSSLFEVDMVEKFTKEMKGKIIQTEIKEIVLDDFFIKIRYEYQGKTYESKMTFGKYMESMKKWFKDPVKEEQQREKFLEKFGVPVEERDKLIGKKIIVEVKAAFGSFYYGDIKPLPED